MYRAHVFLALLLGAAACRGCPDARPPVGEVDPSMFAERTWRVRATVGDAFAAFTTNEGAVTFFAPATNIEPRVGGAYEVFFFPDAPPGERGSEGSKVLVLEPNSRFVVSWGYPPRYPEHRGKLLRVEVSFDRLDERVTKIRVKLTGFIYDANMFDARDFVANMWQAALERLGKRFDTGPLDLAKDPTVRIQ